MSRKPLICVAVPFHGGLEHSFIFQNWLPLYENRNRLDFCNLIISPFLMNDMPHVSAARNHLVEAALDRYADYLYFPDSDMIPRKPPSSVECLRLLFEAIQKEGVDVVSGMYLDKRTMGVCAFKFNEEHKKYLYIPKEALIGKLTRVDAVGMGCALIDTRLFNKIEYPWFKADSIRHQFSQPGEDIYFCEKARELGFGIYVDGSVEFGHIAKTVLTLEDEVHHS